jgi:SAM-dependent methyltransferase
MGFKPIEVLWYLISPLHFLLISLSYLPGTVLFLLASLQFRTLLTPSLLKDAWFARFWSVVGANIRQNCTPRVQPLIAQAHGVVLDIGPGSGEWLLLFNKEKVTKIYGVEPNRDHHERLKERIREAGLEEIYVLVPVGVEELGSWKGKGDVKLGKGEVDSVVTVFCLCSVPEPKRMIVELYGYLKEGGNWIVFEHVITKEGGLIAMYQGEFVLFQMNETVLMRTKRWLICFGLTSSVVAPLQGIL